MPKQYKRRAKILLLVTIGSLILSFALSIILGLYSNALGIVSSLLSLVQLLLILVFFVGWVMVPCWYAKGKGYTWSVGFAWSLLGLLGFIILLTLPDKSEKLLNKP
jgi:hypothetical protein